MTPRAILREMAIALFFVALAVVALRPIAWQATTHTLASGDPLVDLWTVHWLWAHFFEPSQIFEGNTFHPVRHAVVYSDLSLGTVVLLLPLRLLVREPLVVYNLALHVAFAFGGWAFHLLARRLSGDLWAGLMAGTLASFASHQVFHVFHVNLLTIGWLAIFLLGLHEAVSGERPVRAAILAGLGAALSAQSSGYYGVTIVLLAVAFALGHRQALRQRRVLATLAAGALLAVVLAAPYVRAYLRVHEEQGLRRPLGMSVSMAFQPQRDLGSEGLLYGALLGREGERLFPGLLCLLLPCVALARRAPHARFYVATAAALVVISLGPYVEVGGVQVPLPYRALYAIPAFEGMRHPYTFAAVATFLLAVAAATGFARLDLARRAWAGPLLCVLAVAEVLAPAVPLQEIPPGLPPHYALLRKLPPGPILEVPVFSEEALVWAARSGLPMVNGQGSAFVPVDILRIERFITNHWLRRVPDDVDDSRATRFLLERGSARYVVLPLGTRPNLAGLDAAFQRSRVFALVAEASDGARIYEVRGLR